MTQVISTVVRISFADETVEHNLTDLARARGQQPAVVLEHLAEAARLGYLRRRLCTTPGVIVFDATMPSEVEG